MSGLRSQHVEQINDDKIYIQANGIDKSLNQAIIDGDISGGSNAPEYLFYQNFDTAKLADFDQSGLVLETVDPLNGRQSGYIIHDAFTSKHIKEILPVGRKFRSRLYSLQVSIGTEATASNISVEIKDETNNAVITTEQLSNTVQDVTIQTVEFSIPETCLSLSYKITCLPEAGNPKTEFDDIRIIPVEDVDLSPVLYQEADCILECVGNAGQSLVAQVTDVPFIFSKIQGSGINWNGSSFTVDEDGIYSLNAHMNTNVSTANRLALYANGVVVGALGEYVADASHAGRYTGKFLKNITYSLRTSVNTTLSNATNHWLTIVKQGSLKQINRNPNQKIKLPTSEVIMTGSTRIGEAVVFSNLNSIEGDGIQVIQSSGTIFKVSKKCKISLSANARTAGGAWTIYLTRNSSSTSDGVLNAQAQNNANYNTSVSWSGTAHPNDEFRLLVNGNPSGALITVSVEDLEVSVSAPDAIPEYTQSDSIVEVEGFNGYGSSGTLIPRFSSVSVFKGADITYAPSSINGDRFYANVSGLYDVCFYWVLGGTGVRGQIQKEGVNILFGESTGASNNTAFTVSGQIWLDAGQYVSGRFIGSPVVATVGFKISKVGKPNITGIDINPFINLPYAEHIDQALTSSASSLNGTAAINFTTQADSTAGVGGLFQTNSSNGSITILKDCEVTYSISCYDVSSTDYRVNLRHQKLGGPLLTVGNARSRSATQLVTATAKVIAEAGDTIYIDSTGFSGGTGTQYFASVHASIRMPSIINTIAVSDTGKVGELIWSLNPSDPVGFISAANKTIGATGADYSGVQYFTLYSTIWDAAGTSTTATDPFSISSAKGASAKADWDAGKLIRVNFESNEVFIRQRGSARDLGSFEGDAIRNIIGSANFSNDSNQSNGVGPGTNLTGPFYGIGTPTAVIGDANGSRPGFASLGFDASRQVPTAPENRPKNVALNAYIRYSGELNLYIPSNTKYAQKTNSLSGITSNQNNIVDLRFNNLEIGKQYRCSLSTYMNGVPAGQQCIVVCTNNSNIVSRFRLYDSSGVGNAEGGDSRIFTASATTLETSIQLLNASSVSGVFTTVQLEELPYHETTTQWN